MKPYPAYKESGVPWIGEIPEGWEIAKVKHFADIALGKMLTSEDKGGYFLRPYLRAKNLNWISVDTSDVKSMWFSTHELDLYRLEKGDLLVSEGGEVGRTCIWNNELDECYIQNSVNRVRLGENNHPRYFLYQFFAAGQKGHFEAIVNQVSIAHLTKEKLAEVTFVVPPLPEQRAIAAYLDRKTAQIDALIANKRRRLALLAEHRTALISHAVTRGLDPAAPLKDSGVAWIGEIPVGWDSIHLRFASKDGLKNGLFKKGDEFGRGTRLVNVSDVYTDDFTIRENTLERVETDRSELRTYAVEVGDIFFVRSSLKREGIAKAACIDEVTEPIVFECHLIKIIPNNSIVHYKFLTYFLNSIPIRDRLIALSITTTMTTISQSSLASLRILLPPLPEQRAIAAYLDEKTAQIDRAVARTERQIARLEEYRTALISAAVTGKIDVRTARLGQSSTAEETP